MPSADYLNGSGNLAIFAAILRASENKAVFLFVWSWSTISPRDTAMTFNADFSSNLHLISSAEVRHRYGRAFISAPKPTSPSMINTSSPITIQPCNAVMFSSLRIDGAENWHRIGTGSNRTARDRQSTLLILRSTRAAGSGEGRAFTNEKPEVYRPPRSRRPHQ